MTYSIPGLKFNQGLVSDGLTTGSRHAIIEIMKLSKLTISLAAYIIVSASFAQQLFTAADKLFGRPALINILGIVFLAAAASLIYKGARSKIGPVRITLLAAACIAAFSFAWKQPYMAEKTHILEYGLLAWLVMRDMAKTKAPLLKSVLIAFVFTALVGVLDEGFQKLLPWRVYEIRDMVTNAISGALGITVFCAGTKTKPNLN